MTQPRLTDHALVSLLAVATAAKEYAGEVVEIARIEHNDLAGYFTALSPDTVLKLLVELTERRQRDGEP